MHLYCDLIHPGSQVPPVQDANLQTVRLHDVLLSLCVHVKVIFFVCRSMNENARLAEIVEAVKELEQAITKDSGVPSKQQATSMYVHDGKTPATDNFICVPTPQVHRPVPSPITVMRPQALRGSSCTPSSTPPPRSHLAHTERSGIGDRASCEH